MLGPTPGLLRAFGVGPRGMANPNKPKKRLPIGRAPSRAGTGQNVNLFGNKAPIVKQPPPGVQMAPNPGLQGTDSIKAPGGMFGKIALPGRRGYL